MITVTPNAVGKIKEAMATEGRDDLQLRIYVEGGGCSGLQYGLVFEENEKEGDTRIPCDGFDILIDRFSWPYLENITVDYATTLQGAGFKIDNPMAARTCGCGHSFEA